MKEFRGYMMIMLAAVLWGLSATAAKFLLNHQVGTLLIVQTRVTFSCLIMFFVYLVFAPRHLRVRPADLWRFGLLGIAGMAGANFTYYFTIKESTVATAILIQYTAPIFVLAYETIQKEEKFTTVKLIAALLSLLGCFLAVGGYDASRLNITPLGLISGIGSIFCFAFLTVYPRHLLVRYSTWTVIFYSLVGASVFWLFVNPPWVLVGAGPAVDVWGALVVLAVGSVLIPHTSYFGGLRHVVPSRAIITSTLEPVVAIISAAFFLGEFLEAVQAVGAVLVLAAIVVLQVRREPGELEGEHASE